MDDRMNWTMKSRLIVTAAMGCAVTLSGYAAGEMPAIYGPSNIGTLGNGAVAIESDATRPSSSRSIEAVSPCATAFSGPSVFTWAGTTNVYNGSSKPVLAGANFPGCYYTAISDSPWLTVASGLSQTVSYEVARNETPNRLTGHIHVFGTGIVFTLTISVNGDGHAYHSNDYDGGGASQLTVWRPSTGTWYVHGYGGTTNITQQWGLPGDKPVFGDFDGDGVADFTVWRPSNGTWYTLPSGNVNVPTTQQLGVNGDIPVPADYDGDGKTDVAVFRPSNQTWYVLLSSTHTVATQAFGLSGDIPMPADYDADGKTDIAVWRPSTGTWYVLGSADGVVHSRHYGVSTDIPVLTTNFYYGTFIVWRPSTGQFFNTNFDSQVDGGGTQLGLQGDVPTLTINNFAVWRPSNDTWYVGTNASLLTYAWGLNGDVLPGAPHTATQ